MTSANKERKKNLLFGHFKRIARGILWVARFESFVYSIDYSKLKTSRPDTLFLCHTAQTFERFRLRTKCRSVKQMKAKAAFV